VGTTTPGAVPGSHSAATTTGAVPGSNSDATMTGAMPGSNSDATTTGAVQAATPIVAPIAPPEAATAPTTSVAKGAKSVARTTSEVASAKRANAAAKEGTLDLACLPWCEITLDGKSAGLHSPLQGHALPVGNHVIDVVNPPSGKKDHRLIEIRAGETTKVGFRLD
jgi:hypothetical protein